MHDDAAYVPKALLEEFAARDPLERFQAWLQVNQDARDEELAEIEAEVRSTIERGVAEAEASPQPDPATLMDGVYAVSSEP